jgi:hypothetical protein
MSNQDFKAYSNPKIIGPGVWFFLHLKASDLSNEADIVSLANDIDLLKRRFGCEMCRKHIEEFCEKNPPNKAMTADIKDFRAKRGTSHLERWLVTLHNNATKHKYTWKNEGFRPDDVKYEDVHEYFDPEKYEPCEIDDCGGEEEKAHSDTSKRSSLANVNYQSRPTGLGGGSVKLSPRRKSRSPVRKNRVVYRKNFQSKNSSFKPKPKPKPASKTALVRIVSSKRR